MPEECKQLTLPNVWRTCNKIRAALFRTGLNLWEIYKPLDRSNNCLISESKFVSVLRGPLKSVIGLSDQEICDLADYFKVQDGRILYTQFCSVIQSEGEDLLRNKPLTTGLEWSDPYHVNVLGITEERKLKLLLTKMATIVNARKLVLRPYFQDYELVAKNDGTVTLAHFARVLNFLKIHVSAGDFQLLSKKFLKDSYTLNYVAFLIAIDTISKELMNREMFDVGGDLLCQFPGRAIIAEIPKLPRPEVGTVRMDAVFGAQNTFHPVLNAPRMPKDLHEVIRRIQHYVYSERVRVGEFFKDFDLLNTGRVSESAFRRCLEAVGVGESGTRKLHLAQPEVESVVSLYRDPNDPTRIMWRIFEADIDSVFANRGLEKWPEAEIKCPPADVLEIPRSGNVWEVTNQNIRDGCEDVIMILRKKVTVRRLNLRPAFNDYDKRKHGHVTKSQFRSVLSNNGIFLSDDQLYALQQRYMDDLGFHYFSFVKDVEMEQDIEPLYESYRLEKMKVSQKEFKMPVASKETDIVEILAKIKRKLMCERLRQLDFLSQFDPHNELAIKKEAFKRGLDPKLNLTPTEVDILIDVFKSPMRPGYVNYRHFCDVINEGLEQKQLDRAPLVQPIWHIPSEDGSHNFLDFEERQIVSGALHKLAAKSYYSLIDFFKALDKENIGTINNSDVVRALSAVCFHILLSPKEMDVIIKCFAKEKSGNVSFDYLSFMNALQIVSNALKFIPN